MVTITVTGLGLVINKPTAVLFKALTDAGYNVVLEDFDGLHQYVPKENWPDQELVDMDVQQGMQIKICGKPQPWGG